MKFDLHNPETWVAIAFVLFFIIFGKILWNMITKVLDNKISQIKKEVDEAHNLHVEARDLLAKHKKKLEDLESSTQELINKSSLEAKDYIRKNDQKIRNSIERYENILLKKIKRAESQASTEIKDRMIELAITSAESVIKKKLSNKDHKNLIRDSLKELERIF